MRSLTVRSICIEVSHMTGHCSKANKLRNVNTLRGRTGNVPIQKGKIYYVKIKVIALIIYFGLNKPFEIDKCKSQNGASVQKH